MRKSEVPTLFSRPVQSIHCLGIGGMGMAPLAIYLAQSGYSVSGEDDSLPSVVRGFLEREKIALGPVPEKCDLVVYSSAIAAGHPAYAAARARGISLVRRGEMLAEVLRDRKLVAVCGSHGKTTTTAMLIEVLRRANFPAGYLLGGLPADGSPPARVGSNDWVVAEVDESDGTIGHFAPAITVAVNLDWDHPDHYHRLADLTQTFAALFARTKGSVLISDACPISQQINAETTPDGFDVTAITSRPFLTFGKTGVFLGEVLTEKDDEMVLRLGGRFSVGEARVRAQGDFNAANATAALAAAELMGACIDARSLAQFPGVRRRQTVLSTAGGITVLEDYAHHPAEIRALLTGLRKRLPAGQPDRPTGRLTVIFQPHRFSRTAQFKAEFAAALTLADRLQLLDVYSAGEAPVAGGTTADIYAELKRIAPGLAVSYFPGADAPFFRALNREVRAGDVVAFVGAGDVDRKARAWLELRDHEARRARVWDDHAAALTAAVSPETKVRREEPLAKRTTIRVGGAARLFAEPTSTADLQALWRAAHSLGIACLILGRGSNLIVPDEGVDALVLSLGHASFSEFAPQPDGSIWAGAGLRLKNLCGLARHAGLVGFEFLEGIPGSVGGALRMNAGAMGGWMFDIVESVRVLAADGEILDLKRSAMHVDYRHCAELHHAVALGAQLRPAARADVDSIARQIDVYRRKRQESQPREPSAGCIFKNPAAGSAGKLIDESGLKGERVGGAEVSAVHANFIVNRGGATAGDVIELVRRIRERVRQVKGVDLEPEVLLYGADWRERL